MFNSDSSFHLKPLSVYSHMVCRGQKRRLDSRLDEICETPRKKPCVVRSCSQDLGYCSLDFPSGVQGSTPLQPLLITKHVTPPRSKVSQSVTPVVSTPLYRSTPHRMDRDRESLPSPIPVLKWDREVSSVELKLCGSLNFDACASVPSVGSRGAGKRVVREVSHHLLSIHDSKSLSALADSAVLSEEEAVVPVSRQTEPGEAESLENTLRLQVQVKSKVVVVDNTETVWCSGEQWERNKRAYVDSVKRHMKERSGAANGAITELHSLMNSIASQETGRNDPHWRHPADLTRKNFHQSRLKGPSVSLDEWQKINLLAYRRFVNVPDIFHRSPAL